MSDFTEEQVEKEPNKPIPRDGDSTGQPERCFNSNDHIKGLCEDCKVDLGLLGCYLYPKGWREVIEDLVREFRGCDLVITELREELGRLEMHFNTKDAAVETKVWRAINEARIRAKYTCEDCGKKGRLALHGKSRVGVLCDECAKKNDKKAASQRTGTWLDYF